MKGSENVENVENVKNVDSLAILHDHLRAGTAALRERPWDELRRAWNELIDDVLDARSTFWRSDASDGSEDLEAVVCAESGMHPRTLHASLRAALGRYRLPAQSPAPSRAVEPMAAVLAGNVPVLAPQVLLPALLRRRGALIKPASDAPAFTERFVATLQRKLSLSEPAYRARSWRSGGEDDRDLVQHFERIAVYGGEAAVHRYTAMRRNTDQMALFGPRFSVGVLSDRVTPDLDGLARDAALFEQRGCLSVKVVYLLEPSRSSVQFGLDLARALDEAAEALPPSDDLAGSSAARQWFDVARLTGKQTFGTPGRSAVVLDEVGAELPPGGRSVSLRPVTENELTTQLHAHLHHIQGMAWTGVPALPGPLQELATAGAWRVAPAGRLQETAPDWRNGGIDLVEWLA